MVNFVKAERIDFFEASGEEVTVFSLIRLTEQVVDFK